MAAVAEARSNARSPAPASRSASGLLALAALLVISAAAALGTGSFAIAPHEVVAIVLSRFGLHVPVAYEPQQEAVLLAIRLPRVLLAATVGAALGASGAVVQGVFRNPLASPELIGVSGGAALGAAVVIVLGLPAALGVWTLPLAAFGAALAMTTLIYRIARRAGRTEVTTLLLIGIAVNALTGACISLLIYTASEPQLRSVVFWMLGSAAGASWPLVGASAPLVVISVLLLHRFGRALDVLTLGDDEARHLGLDAERVRFACVTLAALATAAATSVVGIVGFVGLVAPHVLRLALGPSHRALVVASALGGAMLLVLADLVSRTAVAPADLPLGLVTSFIGAPVFLYLIERTRARHGWWA